MFALVLIALFASVLILAVALHAVLVALPEWRVRRQALLVALGRG